VVRIGCQEYPPSRFDIVRGCPVERWDAGEKELGKCYLATPFFPFLELTCSNTRGASHSSLFLFPALVSTIGDQVSEEILTDKKVPGRFLPKPKYTLACYYRPVKAPKTLFPTSRWSTHTRKTLYYGTTYGLNRGHLTDIWVFLQCHVCKMLSIGLPGAAVAHQYVFAKQGSMIFDNALESYSPSSDSNAVITLSQSCWPMGNAYSN
jgi:hypothetical protein